MNTINFYSKNNHNKVIEIKQFNNRFVYWLFPEANNYPTLKDKLHIYSNSEEITLTDGYNLIKDLKRKVNLYSD